MSAAIVEQLLRLPGSARDFAKGRHLFKRNDPVSSLYIVRQGSVELIRYQENGSALVLQRATGPQVLAEASLYAVRYHCDALARSDVNVHRLARKDFLQRLAADSTLSSAWASHLAGEVQSARYRCEILSRKTVADRLDAWLTWHDAQMPAKGQWKNLAMQLAVSPEALYREIARRQPMPSGHIGD